MCTKILHNLHPDSCFNSSNSKFPSCECWCWWLVMMNVVGKAFPTWRCSWNLMGRICVILKLLLSRPLPLETLHQLVLYRLERPQHLVAVLPSPHPPLSLHINMAVNAGQQVVPPCLFQQTHRFLALHCSPALQNLTQSAKVKIIIKFQAASW